MSNGVQDSYIVLRQNTYHYRRRVPADVIPYVGVKWWKRSLKTGSKREAEKAARALGREHDDLIESVRVGLSLPEKHAALMTAFDDARGRAVLLARLPDTKGARKLRSALHLTDRDTTSECELATQAAEAAEKIKRVMIAAAEQRLDTLPEADRDAIKKLGGVESFFQQVPRDVRALARDRAALILQEERGVISPRSAEEQTAALQARARHVAKDRQTITKLGLGADDEGYDEPGNPRIKTAMEAWFAERKQGHYAVKRHRIAVNRFVELHGNVAVREINKEMVKSYLKTIENLADHRKLPVSLRGGLADVGADVPRVAAPTVERHLISVKALLTFCVEQEWLTVNVATGLHGPKDTRKKASKRRAFTRDERNAVLSQVTAESGENADMTWLVKVAAYTGCRLEELAQMARKNVRQIDGVWVVEIDDLDGRNVKSQDSARMIPLHPAIRDDFVAWVKAGRGARVFPTFAADKNGRYANQLSGDFARLMDRAGLIDPRLVFHSWRHTLKREMSNARIDPDVRRVILGHAPKDAHDGYEGHSLEAIAEEFARLPPLFD